MGHQVKEPFLVSTGMTFFLVHGMQVGIGALSFQRAIVKISGYDGWISIIIAGIVVQIIIALMYALLNRANGDLISVHKDIFGKWLGGVFSVIFGVYLLLLAVVILRIYIQIVQAWVFHDLPTWIITLILAWIFYLLISGGFRKVVGICFLGVIVPAPLFTIVLMPLEFGHFINMLPIWKHTLSELIAGAKEASLSYLGFEILLLCYPFIKQREKSHKWAQLGGLMTIFAYTSLMVISLAFYSEEQLHRTIWATLTLFKVVEFPFIERFEYIGISLWLLLISPNIALTVWGASRIGKRVLGINQRTVLVFVIAALALITMFLQTSQEIETLALWVSEFGFYFVGVYVPLLVMVYLAVSHLRSGADEKTTTG